jgi:hypothetical protein
MRSLPIPVQKGSDGVKFKLEEMLRQTLNITKINTLFSEYVEHSLFSGLCSRR